MKIIRYVNGKKVVEPEVESANPVTSPVQVPAPVKRIIKKISTPDTVKKQPSKGCGCGK